MIRLSKIVLEINGQEIELSIPDAKEVKRILDQILEEKEATFIPSYPQQAPQFTPSCPTYKSPEPIEAVAAVAVLLSEKRRGY